VRIEGRKAVVTGGTHGIGPAAVEALFDGGAEVPLTGRDERNIEAARHQPAGRAARVVRFLAFDACSPPRAWHADGFLGQGIPAPSRCAGPRLIRIVVSDAVHGR
jgi:short-subunit dehydrogenase